jgi:DNA modification methylase
MKIGNGSSYIGDTVEIMKDLIAFGTKVDFVLTSPPYNMRGHAKEIYNNAISFDDNKTNEDYQEWIVEIFKCYDSLLNKNGVVLFNLNYMSSLQNRAINVQKVLCAIEEETPFTLIENICWKKTTAMPLQEARLSRIWENVWVFIKDEDWKSFWEKNRYSLVGKQNYIEAPNNDGASDVNKACFSSSMVEQLLRIYNIEKSHIVLDNFMGTHTTAVACEKIGCPWIGIELDEKTFVFGKDRVNAFIGKYSELEKHGAHNLFTVAEKGSK